MMPMICAAFVAAYLVIIGHWHLMSYWQYPRALMWVAALPVWLLAVPGADRCHWAATHSARTDLGLARGCRILSVPPKALIYASVSPVLIGNPATLGVFSVFVFFWLMKEITTFESHAPPALLEWGGRWSYSLYLVHTIIIVTFVQRGGWINHFVRWPLRLTAILAASYAFYCVVERPAHMLARSLGRRLAAGPLSAVVPIVRPVQPPPEAPR